MIATLELSDRLAIGLSMLCMFHCLVLPLLLVLIPNLTILHLDNEAFHAWMVCFALPTSLYALFTGCKQHQQYRLLILGFTGLACLTLAVLLGHEFLGESGDTVLTVIGSTFIVVGHLFNFRLCHTATHSRC